MKKDGVPAVFLCKRSFQCVFPNPAIKSRRQRAGRQISVIYVLFLRLKGVKNKRPEVCENHTDKTLTLPSHTIWAPCLLADSAHYYHRLKAISLSMKLL